MKKSFLKQTSFFRFLISFLFILSYVLNTYAQQNDDGSITLSKTITPRTDNCRQFDVELQIIGNPQPALIDVVVVIDASASMGSGFGGSGAIEEAQDAAWEFSQYIIGLN